MGKERRTEKGIIHHSQVFRGTIYSGVKEKKNADCE